VLDFELQCWLPASVSLSLHSRRLKPQTMVLTLSPPPNSLDSIKKSIESRKPDFDAYIDPQKKHADMIIQVLPTQLVPDDEGKILRVRLIQKEGKKLFGECARMGVGGGYVCVGLGGREGV